MNYKKRERIEQLVCDIYITCGIRTFPIDCKDVLAHYGLKAVDVQSYRERNPELYTLCLKCSDDAFLYRAKKLIVYHNKWYTRTRFSLMHELGHYLLGHVGASRENEVQANYFASCILMPRPAIGWQDSADIRYLSGIFKTSYAAMEIAVTGYLRWFDRQKYAPMAPWDRKLQKWLSEGISEAEIRRRGLPMLRAYKNYVEGIWDPALPREIRSRLRDRRKPIETVKDITEYYSADA